VNRPAVSCPARVPVADHPAPSSQAVKRDPSGGFGERPRSLPRLAVLVFRRPGEQETYPWDRSPSGTRPAHVGWLTFKPGSPLSGLQRRGPAAPGHVRWRHPPPHRRGHQLGNGATPTIALVGAAARPRDEAMTGFIA
jgi:hypothetical protein